MSAVNCVPDLHIDPIPRFGVVAAPPPIPSEPFFPTHKTSLLLSGNIIISGCVAAIPIPLNPLNPYSVHVQWVCSQKGINPAKIDVNQRLKLKSATKLSNDGTENKINTIQLDSDNFLFCPNTLPDVKTNVGQTNNPVVQCPLSPSMCPPSKQNLVTTSAHLPDPTTGSKAIYLLHGCIYSTTNGDSTTPQHCSYLNVPSSYDCLSPGRAQTLSMTTCSASQSNLDVNATDFITAASLVAEMVQLPGNSSNPHPPTSGVSPVETNQWNNVSSEWIQVSIIVSTVVILVIVAVGVVYRQRRNRLQNDNRRASVLHPPPPSSISQPIATTVAPTLPIIPHINLSYPDIPSSISIDMEPHSTTNYPDTTSATLNLSGVTFFPISVSPCNANNLDEDGTTIDIALQDLMDMWDTVFIRFKYHCVEAVRAVSTDSEEGEQFREALVILMSATMVQIWHVLETGDNSPYAHVQEVVKELNLILTQMSKLFPDMRLMRSTPNTNTLFCQQTMTPDRPISQLNLDSSPIRDMIFPGLFDMKRHEVIYRIRVAL